MRWGGIISSKRSRTSKMLFQVVSLTDISRKSSHLNSCSFDSISFIGQGVEFLGQGLLQHNDSGLIACVPATQLPHGLLVPEQDVQRGEQTRIPRPIAVLFRAFAQWKLTHTTETGFERIDDLELGFF